MARTGVGRSRWSFSVARRWSQSWAKAARNCCATSTVAVPDDEGYRLSGEKWFVTSGDIASVIIVMANVLDGDERRPTLFLVDVDAPL